MKWSGEMLKETTLFGEIDKVELAIERLKQFEPPEGYYLAFSGGKDSVVIKRLAEMSGVKFDAHYNLTTVDPPELVQFIRREHPEVEWNRPKETMWDLIVRHCMPPTRIIRYCCRDLKEGGGIGRFCITGVRWAESVRRKNQRAVVEINARTKNQIMLNNDNDEARRMIETCVMKSAHILNPIVDWTDKEVWQFIHENEVPYCSLYDEGFTRLGCVLCPNGSLEQKKRQIERWPKVVENYRRACRRAYASRVERGIKTENWTSGDDMFEWWINGSPQETEDENQQRFFFE
jgi:phosphoadenosine phosphosulfate reductase